MEYRILQSRHLATIEKKADNFCKDGYVPGGALVVQRDPDGGESFYQVMTLRKTPKTAEDSQNSVQQLKAKIRKRTYHYRTEESDKITDLLDALDELTAI